MTLDKETCYRALRSRDPRFDGKFFTAVTSTGIYCRPVCPAPTPKFENVTFFQCAASAEEAGFRPCRRCRPEAAPGTPAWNGTATSVARGMRLIEQGFLDDHSVDELATILGMGGRHLRRLFLRHLGASPKAVDSTRKAHFAARLLAETDLPITAVALDAGYSSIRRFNESFKKSFGRSPSEVRERRRSGRATAIASDRLTLRIAYRPPYDWDGILTFLKTRAIVGVESVEDGRYARSVQVGGWTGVVEVSPEPGANALRVSMDASAGDSIGLIVEGIRRIFDLRSDPDAVAAHLSQDPLLRNLIEHSPGRRIPGVWDPFESGVRALVGQQISVIAAIRLLGRISALAGRPLAGREGANIRLLFPEPAELAGADLSSIGMPETRRKSVRAVAAAVADGSLSFDHFESSEEFSERLCELPGIGPWSAEYILLRGVGEPDAFPASDLGIRKALTWRAREHALSLGARRFDDTLIATNDVLALAEKWRPWRGYAAIHLWQYLATGQEQVKNKESVL
ncbi:MAG TPA: DNA-3-methyladenine glycosylase 2 family protein [Spirochaetia bacterium]|nr:DNA-3-methyladenine glycosylase 2 family protein [Spirochaetia bacterium]